MASKKGLTLPFITSILLFCFCDPYFLWGVAKVEYVFLFLKFVLFFIFLLNIDIHARRRGWIVLGFFLLVLSIPITQGRNLVGAMVTLLVCTIPFAKEKFAFNTYNSFLSIYSFLISISAIVWLMSLVGIAPRLGVIPPLNELKLHNYSVYPLLVIANVPDEFARFSGLFDEAGVVGTLNALLLTIGKFDLRDKRLLISFVTGFFSLSFFFIVIVFAYYILHTILKSNNKKRIVVFLLFFILFVVLTYNNDFFYDIIWRRFEWDPNRGSIAGDNRIGADAKLYFASIVGTKEFFFGAKDYSYFEDIAAGGFSIIMPIVQYGIVFISSYIGLFIWLGKKYKNDTLGFLFFIFVFLGTIYQRPALFEPEFLFLFSLMAICCGTYSPIKKVVYK